MRNLNCLHCKKKLEDNVNLSVPIPNKINGNPTKKCYAICLSCGNVMVGGLSSRGELMSVASTPEKDTEETKRMIVEARKLFEEAGVGGVGTVKIKAGGKYISVDDIEEELDDESDENGDDTVAEDSESRGFAQGWKEVTEKLEKDIANLEERFVSSNDYVDKMNNKISELENTVDALNEKNNKLRDCIVELSAAVDGIRSEMKNNALQDYVTDLGAAVETITKTLKDHLAPIPEDVQKNIFSGKIDSTIPSWMNDDPNEGHDIIESEEFVIKTMSRGFLRLLKILGSR